jgi:small subunit ribosomal protein S21
VAPYCPFFAPVFQRRWVSADEARTLKRREKKGRRNLEVKVFDNDVEKALKILKNKLSKSGLFKELKLRRAYEKPSVKKKRKAIEARRRLAKVQRRKVN